MKKLLLMLSFVFLFAGCTLGKDMMNTPTKKVEEFLGKYQTLDDDVLKDLDGIVKEDESFNSEQRQRYTKIFKKHYESLKYDIKDEIMNGDKATVEVEIEVTDYSKILAAAESYMNANPDEFKDENGIHSTSKFIDYQLDQLENAKDSIVYTLSLTLSKVDDEWKLDPLTDIQEQKIHGVYVY